jgi:glucokinase
MEKDLPMTSSLFPRLVADVGGTNVRFASQFLADGPLLGMASYPCAEFPGLWEAMQHHLHEQGLARPRACAIGIATAITGDQVQMTNHHWSFSIEALRQALGAEHLLVINDFTALALSLPGVGGAGLAPIGGEGGHVTLSSFEPEEDAVLKVLQRRFGHVSAERALSGPGLENLYQALAGVRGQVVPERGAASITAGEDRLARDTVELFCSLLGNVAGNVALTLGARGGLYIGGGIVPRLGERFDRSRFRERFEAKGRFRDYLAAIPAFVVSGSDQAALLGACRALDAAKH